jgi:UDP-2,4-diacetamido-2,4,6-trideoxy-beta-L-altropyranose hydrolase
MENNRLEQRIAFRVDVSINIGTGHFMRCLTVANSLSKYRIKSVFFCRDLDNISQDILIENKHEFYNLSTAGIDEKSVTKDGPDSFSHADWLVVSQEADANQCIEELKKHSWLGMIIDHYGIGKTWEKKVSLYTSKMIIFDDLADRSHYCHLLIDQNLGRNKADYYNLVPKDCTLLVGPQYALLRPEFLEFRNRSIANRKKSNRCRILISMGGLDQDNYTHDVLETLNSCMLDVNTQVTVVLGRSSPWIDDIKNLVSNFNYEIQVIVGAENMAELMSKSRIAIGAAGSSAWERCCLGVPALCFVIAENQREAAVALENHGAASIASIENLTVDTLQLHLDRLLSDKNKIRMQENCLGIVDGKGLARVTRFLVDKLSLLALRNVSLADSNLLLQWRNDPATRKNSLNTAYVEFDDHNAWFSKKYSSPDNCRIYIAELCSNIPIGQVRFDLDDDANWMVNYSIAPYFRELGLGAKMLTLAIHQLRELYPNCSIIAKIKDFNVASKRIFESIDFELFDQPGNGMLCYSYFGI